MVEMANLLPFDFIDIRFFFMDQGAAGQTGSFPYSESLQSSPGGWRVAAP
jgi:hypothetical protein